MLTTILLCLGCYLLGLFSCRVARTLAAGDEPTGYERHGR